jgi:hypothetical protein
MQKLLLEETGEAKQIAMQIGPLRVIMFGAPQWNPGYLALLM